MLRQRNNIPAAGPCGAGAPGRNVLILGHLPFAAIAVSVARRLLLGGIR